MAIIWQYFIPDCDFILDAIDMFIADRHMLDFVGVLSIAHEISLKGDILCSHSRRTEYTYTARKFFTTVCRPRNMPKNIINYETSLIISSSNQSHSLSLGDWMWSHAMSGIGDIDWILGTYEIHRFYEVYIVAFSICASRYAVAAAFIWRRHSSQIIFRMESGRPILLFPTFASRFRSGNLSLSVSLKRQIQRGAVLFLL